MEIVNKIGLCISYNELQRIDFGLMKRVTSATGSNRVPISLSIDKKTLIHGVMDNFDYNEAISSGIGGTQDAILMLFQNQNENENSPKALNRKPKGSSQNQKSLDKILPCQELIKICTFGGRGEIPEFNKQYRLWTLAWYQDESPIANGPQVPPFAAVKSLLASSTHSITEYTLAPIFLYPVTKVILNHDHDWFPGCTETKAKWK